MRWLFIVLVLALSTGCAGILPALQAASQGSQFLASVLDLAEAGSEAYFDRHPSPGDEPRVSAALLAARRALAALDHVLTTTESIDAGDVEKARSEALKAYAELRFLLAELGVLSGTPPAGGAETTAPEPGELVLPTEADVDAAL